MSKKSFTILIIVIVVIVGGIYLVKLNRSSNQEPTTEQKQASVNPEQKVDTSDWKTYQNEKNGYVVKYPSAWTLEDREKLDSVGFISSDYTQNPDQSIRSGSRISINVIENKEKYSLETYLGLGSGEPPLIAKKKLEVSGFSAVQEIHRGRFDPSNEQERVLLSARTVFQDDNFVIYEIKLKTFLPEDDAEGKKPLGIYEEMANSFVKF